MTVSERKSRFEKALAGKSATEIRQLVKEERTWIMVQKTELAKGGPVAETPTQGEPLRSSYLAQEVAEQAKRGEQQLRALADYSRFLDALNLR